MVDDHDLAIRGLVSRHEAEMNAFKEESEQKEAMSRAFFESREQELIAQMESIMSELITSQANAEKQSEALKQQFDLSLAQQQQLDLLKTHQAAMQKLHERQLAQQSGAVASLDEQSKALMADYERKVVDLRSRASRAVRWLVQRMVVYGDYNLRAEAKAMIHKAKIEIRAAELTLKGTEEGSAIKVAAAAAEAAQARRQAEDLKAELMRVRKAANVEVESYKSQMESAQLKLETEVQRFKATLQAREDQHSAEVRGVKGEYVEAVENFEWSIQQLEVKKAEMEQKIKRMEAEEERRAAGIKKEVEEKRRKEVSL